MSLIDGVNKVFKVQHVRNAMHIEGFKSEREMVEQMLYNAGFSENGFDDENQVAWLRSLPEKINAAIADHLTPHADAREEEE